MAGFQDVLPILREHHEWVDGGGYPAGLAGAEINWLARIVAVADCFDALASDRPYRKGLEPLDALRKIEEASGSQFDPRVVEALKRLIEQSEIRYERPRLLQLGPVHTRSA